MSFVGTTRENERRSEASDRERETSISYEGAFLIFVVRNIIKSLALSIRYMLENEAYSYDMNPIGHR